MNTKICSNCGWEYPISQPGIRCKICGEVFTHIKCLKCGKIWPKDRIAYSGEKYAVCKSCVSKESMVQRDKRYARLTDNFDVWLEKINAVPKDYPTLTEQQWLDACRFFDGCARCGSDDIDARGFFVGATLGGRYCEWNIIPLCERCASRWKLDANAFKYIYKQSKGRTSSGYFYNLQKIIEYLGGKLDNAAGFTTEADQDTECE